jgi:hypothetical protein
MSLLTALEELLHPPAIVIIRGVPAAIEGWRRVLTRAYAPRQLVIAIPSDVQDLPPGLADKSPRGDAVAYVCRGNTCSAPLDSLEALLERLRDKPH